ncbi:hypothetical protein [Serratia sp. Se-RSBMAAmG]|uniref:hypothetical protein n=1 Tax=Serratia sp. Se-RSBMAAmG TaxID=3043305 RepID=UPI0024AFB4DD|nr:hypothetical protein [Serratia sp. Se-RSBMAAmG]MDI6976490.1 hypothetical protein [Serratia sp. Se-RSBMAAmG]
MTEDEEQSRLKDKEKLKLLIETLDRNAALAVKGEAYQKVGIRFVAMIECPYDEAGVDIIDETELFCNEGADGETCDFIDGDVFKELLSQYLTHFTEVFNTDSKYKDVPKYKFSFGIEMIEGKEFGNENTGDGILEKYYDFILDFYFNQIEDIMEVIKQ